MLSRRRAMATNDAHVINGIIQDSWSTIISICKAGKAKDYYSVGDHKLITCNGETFYMDYLGQGLDPRADRKSNANLTSWLARSIPWEHQWGASTSAYWEISDIRSFCLTTIYNGLPEEVRAAIVPVEKLYADSAIDPDPESSMTIDTVWIPDGDDINFNRGRYKARFPDKASLQKTGATTTWWLSQQSINGVVAIGPDGSSGYNYRATNVFGVVPGFCI